MAVGNFDSGIEGVGQPIEPVGTFAARWDGTSWTLIESAADAPNPNLLSISCASPTFCVAVGMTQTQIGGLNRSPTVEMWNGADWTVAATPVASVKSGVLTGVSCTSATFCLAVGSPESIVWRGNGWTQVNNPTVRYHSSLAAISCPATDECTAVGSYSIYKTGAYVYGDRPLAARWNGGRWTIARPPPELVRYQGKLIENLTTLNGVSCVSRMFCLAIGDTQRAQNGVGSGAFADAWNGRSWARATSGLPHNSPFVAVSCLSSTNCVAAGQYDNGVFPAPASVQPLIENWNGSGWARTALPQATTESGVTRDTLNLSIEPGLHGIACMSLRRCTAVGNQSSGNHSSTLVVSGSLPVSTPLPVPVFGHTANLQPVSGRVLVRLPKTKTFESLPSARSIPLGSVIDATAGTVMLTTAATAPPGGHAAPSSTGATETGVFHAGVFRLTQTRARSGVRGGRLVELTVLTLAGPRPSCGVAHAGRLATVARKRPRRRTRKLWGNGKGNFRTTGANASATVRGTEWLTEDTCAGTLIRVARGVVSVDDFSHHRTFLVRAPHSFLAHRGTGG